jgi:hypothetical protein
MGVAFKLGLGEPTDKRNYLDVTPMRSGRAVATARVAGWAYDEIDGYVPEYGQETFLVDYFGRRIKTEDLIDSQALTMSVEPYEQQGITVLGPYEHRAPHVLQVDAALMGSLVETLREMWINDTRYISSFHEIFDHQAVGVLVGLGRAVVPFILNHVDDEPERWSYVLAQITHAQPVPARAGREAAGAAWRAWAHANGWA